jgi:hypothetical protein
MHVYTHTHTHTHTNAYVSYFFFPFTIYYGSSKAVLRLYQGTGGGKTLRLNTALLVP